MLHINSKLNNMCRICAKTTSTMNLFSLYEYDPNGVPYREKFEMLSGLETDDYHDLPKTVCNTCRKKLNHYYEFRNLCLNSQVVLKKRISRVQPTESSIELNNYTEDCEETRYYIEIENEDAINEDELLLEDIERFFIAAPLEIKVKTVAKTRQKLYKNKVGTFNKKHRCKICKKCFSSELGVKLHIQRIHKKIYLAECKVQCPKCGMKFQQARNLKRHLVYHNTDSYFACEFCPHKSYSKKSWRKHIKIHDEKINIICKICNKTITSKLSQIYHMEYHHTKEILKSKSLFHCQTCGIDFKIFSELEKHSSEKHNLKTPQELDSQKLDKKFAEVEQNIERLFSDEIETGDNDKSTVYDSNSAVTIIKSKNCEEVTKTDTLNFMKDATAVYEKLDNEKSTTYDSNLENNINSENLNNIDPKSKNNEVGVTKNKSGNETLNFMNDATSIYEKLSADGKNVSKCEINNFKCNICSRLYKCLADLKFHVDECFAKIDRPKSFMCDICGKCFSTAWTLTNHKAGHSSARPYICDVCGQRFKWHNDLTNHKNRIHEKLRPYVCKICGKQCTTSATLKSHGRLHTGDKPFSCTVCGARFTQNSSLKEHGFKHTGGVNIACPVCNKVFQTPLRLRTHLKRHNSHRKLYPCDKCGRMFTEKSSVRKHYIKIHHSE